MLPEDELNKLPNKSHYLRFAVITEHSIPIYDFVSEEKTMQDFSEGKFDNFDTVVLGKPSVVSVTVDTVHH